jgi:hypothetical protein
MRPQEDEPMIPMTTQHLGRQPGRARLGVAVRCDRHRHAAAVRTTMAVPAVPMTDAGNWRLEVVAPVALPVNADMAAAVNGAAGYLGTTTSTTGLGICSIKRTARHLGTGST